MSHILKLCIIHIPWLKGFMKLQFLVYMLKMPRVFGSGPESGAVAT